MAITTIKPFWLGTPQRVTGAAGALTIDAAGESQAIIGQVFLEGGSGSKVISSAGGKIYWRTVAVTAFAQAGTTLRIGIQDVASTGLPDTTWDVYADLVGGTDTLTASTPYATAMESGTKTIAHGDLIAVVVGMTSRQAADSISVAQRSLQIPAFGSTGLPYGVLNGSTKDVNDLLFTAIEFDDGTMGWFIGFEPDIYTSYDDPTQQLFNVGSTPDEYAAVLSPPVAMRVNALAVFVGDVATADDFEIILYSDAEGTPDVIQTVAVDPDLIAASATAAHWVVVPITEVTLTAGGIYAVSLRATTANDISAWFSTLGSAWGNKTKVASLFGTSMKFSARTGQTGAFTEVQPYYVPNFGISVNGLEDGRAGFVATAQEPVILSAIPVGY